MSGGLSGSGSSAATAANLTSVGTSDWAHWGDGGAPGLVRKAGGGSQIGAYTVIDSGTPTSFNNSPRALSWSDGTPTATASANTNGLYISGGTYSVTVPAGTEARTVTVYVGGWNSSATFKAHLSDGSAADYTDVVAFIATPYVRTYTVTYNAASSNQTLTLTWSRTAGTGNVDLNAVALGSVAATNQPPVVQSPGARTGTVGVALSLAISASDPNADALTYSATGLPAGVSINAATGVISGTPTAASTYSTAVTVNDGRGGTASTNFTWTIQAAPTQPGGSVLNGSAGSSTALVDLSAVGTVDWAHWGDGVPGLVRKSGGSAISAYTVLQGSTPESYNNDLRGLSWSGGSPNATGVNNKNGLFVSGQGNGFSISVPASTAQASVTVYVGGWASSGTLRAHLSDSSAPDFTNTTAAATDQYVRAYTINFAAASAGQRLVITWTQASASGNVTLNGAALGAPSAPANRAPLVTTPFTQTSPQNQALTLGISASDADGDKLSYSAAGLPTGLSINTTTGAIGGTPTAAGTFSPVVTVNDGRGGTATASFSWVVQAPPTQPSAIVSGSSSSSTALVDLSAIGTTDWAHWGDGVPGLARKTGGSAISAYTVLQGTAPQSYNNDPRGLSWSGGSPNAIGTNNKNGVFVSGLSNGFSISVPASTTRATVTVYVGGWNSSATLRAHLSDNSAPDFTDTTAASADQYVRAYTITFAAASAGQRLVITWMQASSSIGNVTLNGAALAAASTANTAPTITTPAAQSSTQGQAVSMGISARDADGNTLSFSATGLPAGLSINTGTGVIGGTPSTVANYSPSVIASDGRGGTATASFAWSVTASTPTTGSGLDSRPSNTICVAPARPQSGTGVQLARVFPNLSFSLPVGMFQPPNDSSRWYVIEQQTGLVRSFPNSQTAQSSDVKTFIDLSSKIQTDSEMGLLGLAFHPQWPATPYVYLYYSTGGNPVENHVSRFTSPDGGATLNINSEQVLLRLVKNQNDTNHNGGNIVFGPDGYLYIGTGDGGGGGDPNGNSQNRNVLFGKMLRIDVSPATGYAIPSTNPYGGNARCTNGSGSAPCAEIYAYGLRNPWRWSFDRSNGNLWVGDVGQDQREEVNVVTRGGDYGWRLREGSICYNPSNCGTTGPNGEALVDPVVEYGHDIGQAITGGYVYRGSKVPSLAGKYVFGDYVSSRIFAFTPPSSLVAANPRVVLTASNTLLSSPQNITSFAQGNDGELYVVGYGGALYQLQAGSAAVDTIPTLLSQTGCVASGNATQPATGLIPYGVNAPFWSDGADKTRWLAVPNGTSITPQSPGRWTPPNGTVLMKNFKLNNQLIETRLLMRHPDGVWAGYTYEWNAAQTDATRVVGGKTKTVGSQSYVYPNESDCLRCHTQVAGYALGLETAQLNGNLPYPATGRTANQITTLNTLGLLSPNIAGTPSSLAAYVDPHGAAGTVEQRARAFLHANCSQCHQPNGPTPVALDLRYTTPLAQTGTCNATPTSGTLGITNAKVIAPGAPDSSVLLSRINRRDTFQMPPLGSTLVDTQSVAVVRQWIQGLTGCP